MERIVGHNILFEVDFFPRGVLNGLQIFCTMRSLTEYCALPRLGQDNLGEYKFPRLEEAKRILQERGDFVYLWPREVVETGKFHSALYDAQVTACLAVSCIRMDLDSWSRINARIGKPLTDGGNDPDWKLEEILEDLSPWKEDLLGD